jgi:AcrR family transcriptional regulator
VSAAAPTPTRTQQVEARRAELLDAAERVVLQRGFAETRVADVAAESRVSGGLIHYHFASKDQLLTAMLRSVAERDIARARRLAAGPGSAATRLDKVMREWVPGSAKDQSWVLWIDAWGSALRDGAMREISEELDDAWVQVLEQVIRDGAESGEFDCPDPAASAWRLAALLDGLGLRITLQRGSMSKRQMIEHARIVAATEVGVDVSSFAAPAGRR